MKYDKFVIIRQQRTVAPLAGAWIEIMMRDISDTLHKVAPLAGAWIEIMWMDISCSLHIVAPLAGAWIEIPEDPDSTEDPGSRSPRGSVD